LLKTTDLISIGLKKTDPDSESFEELNVLAEGLDASLEARKSLIEFCLKVSFFPF